MEHGEVATPPTTFETDVLHDEGGSANPERSTYGKISARTRQKVCPRCSLPKATITIHVARAPTWPPCTWHRRNWVNRRSGYGILRDIQVLLPSSTNPTFAVLTLVKILERKFACFVVNSLHQKHTKKHPTNQKHSLPVLSLTPSDPENISLY